MAKVKLNKDVCIGCGACCAIAPECFNFGEESAEIVNEHATENAMEASDCCPVGAIEIVEDNA